jgi:hypothetical protein
MALIVIGDGRHFRVVPEVEVAQDRHPDNPDWPAKRATQHTMRYTEPHPTRLACVRTKFWMVLRIAAK